MILWADSFDHYGTDKQNMLDGSWAEVAQNASISTTHPRTGTHGMLLGGNNGIIRRVLGGAKPTAGLGAAWFFPFLPNQNALWRIYGFQDSNNKPQVTIFLDSTGQLSCYRGNGSNETPAFGAVLLGKSDPDSLVTARSQNHIEAKVSIGGSGSVEVRLNGVTILNLTGVNTVNNVSPALGESSTSQVKLGPASNLQGFDGYLDDIIAWDDTGSFNNDFIGDKKVFTDFPDADTAEVDFTPSTGSARYAMIDDPDPDADSTYDEAGSAGDRMGVTFPDVNAATISIAAICLVHKSEKTDAGVCNFQVHAAQGGDEADGIDRPLTTAYTNYLDAFEVNPHTSAPWTPSEANSMSAVIERTA